MGAVCVLLLCVGARAAEDFKPDDQGFLRNWLVLAPIALDDGQSGADGIAKEQVPNEAKLHPKDGDKITVGNKELAWKKQAAGDYFLDVNGGLGQETENSVAYAVCYVVAGDEMTGLKLKIGSDDQAKVYLNGKELVQVTDARSLEMDQNTLENVTLRKGENVLVLKIVNEGGDWSGCARFVDKDDKPVTNLKVALSPG